MRHAALAAALAALVLGACATQEKKEEVPSKDTYECTLQDERLVVRFVDAEARMLMPGGERMILYQIPAASGVRFTNGLLELRGKGMQLQLVENGIARTLEGCKPVMVPKEEPAPWEKWLPQPKKNMP